MSYSIHHADLMQAQAEAEAMERGKDRASMPFQSAMSDTGAQQQAQIGSDRLGMDRLADEQRGHGYVNAHKFTARHFQDMSQRNMQALGREAVAERSVAQADQQADEAESAAADPNNAQNQIPLGSLLNPDFAAETTQIADANADGVEQMASVMVAQFFGEAQTGAREQAVRGAVTRESDTSRRQLEQRKAPPKIASHLLRLQSGAGSAKS